MEMKYTPEKVSNRITEAEGWISELEDRWWSSLPWNRIKKKRMKRNKDSLRDPWENIQWTNVYIIGVLKGKVFPHGSDHRESACNAGDLGLIPGMARALGKGNSYPLSILAWRILWTEDWWTTVLGLQRVRHDWETNTFKTLEGKQKGKEPEKIFEEIMGILPSHGKGGSHLSPGSTESPRQDVSKEEHAKTRSNQNDKY